MGLTMKLKKCVFLDRDGVINEDRGDYTYRVEDFHLISGVTEAIRELKTAGYLLVVITNQAGISKGIYTREQMNACHRALQDATGDTIDHIYYCPYHPVITESLGRKPGTLMIEKAVARYHIDLSRSWLIGDAVRDIECGLKMGLKTIFIAPANRQNDNAHFHTENLLRAVKEIILPVAHS